MEKYLRLYLHIPFCVRKCNYCDFVSFAGKEDLHGAYVNALCNEIRAYGKLYRLSGEQGQEGQNGKRGKSGKKGSAGQGVSIVSVYIGGGTPSVLEPALMEKIVQTVKESFPSLDVSEKRKFSLRPKVIAGMHNPAVRKATKEERRQQKAAPDGMNVYSLGEKMGLDEDTVFYTGLWHTWDKSNKVRPITEFSIECNPGTVDKKKLKAYRKLGINRISFGLQSADPAELRALGRIHTFDDFIESFEAARDAEFNNINVDLMQAIPGQTRNSWVKTLMLLATWKPEHISAYSLIVEEGTPFYEMQKSGKLVLPDEDTERGIYYDTKEYLEKAGYWRYEISNYALPGFECQHNVGYWMRDNYLGLGLNASSMVDNVRWKNTAELEAYIEAFSDPARAEAIVAEAFAGGEDAGDSGNAGVICERHKLSHREQMEEFMFLGLRMTQGISRQEFFDAFGQDFDFTYGEVVQDLVSKELLVSQGDRVYLTDRGIDVSNQVLAEFLLDK